MAATSRDRAKYPTKPEVGSAAAADMLATVVESGIIASRMLRDRAAQVRQLPRYRNDQCLLFGDA